MKKSLLAVAALTAFAGAAQAQSSVTVYGIMDAGFIGENARVSDGKAVTKTTGNGFGSSAESTSRLGFKGTEDLGGCTSAFFTVELGLTPNNTFAINTGVSQNRQSFVGLKKNGLGDFAVGTQYTLIHTAVAATDAGQQNNVAGNLIYTSAVSPVGGNNGSAFPGSSSSIGGGSGTAGGDSYTIRTNNTLSLNTATFSGFTAHGTIVANNTNTTQTASGLGNGSGYTGGINNFNGWSLGADYTWNKLYATAVYQSFTSKNPSSGVVVTDVPAVVGTTAANKGTVVNGAALATTVANTAITGSGQGSQPGLNVKDNQWYVAATYDFGILKAYAQYLSRKATSQIDPLSYVSRTAEQIGVRSYITPTIEAWASGSLGRYTAFGAGAPTANLTAWQIGSNYYLSKRTNLYAIYGQQGTSNINTGTLYTSNPSSYNLNNYAIGLRHTF